MLKGFDRFLEELSRASPAMEYVWSDDKSVSAKWMLDRIPAGSRGVDVGGTVWLCQQLAAKGCDAVCYDLFPTGFPKSVQGDMTAILEHFEERSLDFITTRHTLEHAVCPMFQLWAYNRLLKDDGRLLVIVPQHAREWIWFGTHHNCLPRENWIMLFHRMGFRIAESDAGSWKPHDSKFIEYRFDLCVETRQMRLGYSPAWLPF